MPSGLARLRWRPRFIPKVKRNSRIEPPEICGNLCFGGEKRYRLFMASSQSLCAVYVETQGAHIC